MNSLDLANPIMHPATKVEIDNFISNPVHALGISGSRGVGKKMVALWLCSQIANKSIEDIKRLPYFKSVRHINNTITIDQIREFNNFMKLKTAGDGSIRRFVIIEDADLMNQEAQNAILKNLEEPPLDSLIILTFTNQQSLLPTVLSRLRTITIKQPSMDSLRTLCADQEMFSKVFAVSGNLPGLMHAMLSSDSEYPLLAAIHTSRELLQQTVYQRLARVEELSKDKIKALELTEALQRMAQAAIARSNDSNSTGAIKRWQKVLKAGYRANLALLANAQTKLAITNLCLEI